LIGKGDVTQVVIMRGNNKNYNKFWEELIAYFPFTAINEVGKTMELEFL
jgi:hypothetical protein